MKRRSGIQLRKRSEDEHSLDCKRRKKQSKPAPACSDPNYERDRKRKYRDSKRKEDSKRGRKPSVNIKGMSVEEKRKYYSTMKQIKRLKEKQEKENLQLNATVDEEVAAEESVVVDELEVDNVDSESDMDSQHDVDADIDFDMETAAAVLNMIPPIRKKRQEQRKRTTEKHLHDQVKYCLDKLETAEVFDVFVVLVHALSDEVKTQLKDKGVEVRNISRQIKRPEYSTLSKSSKHRSKDKLLSIMERYTEEATSSAIMKILHSTADVWRRELARLDEFCGI